MFRLFRTEKNPKGPSLKKMQDLHFDFVDSKLQISLPYSNDSVLEKTDNVNQSINIYDHSIYKDDNINPEHSFVTIFKRDYEYSRFNHKGFANIMMAINIFRCNNVDNLLDREQLKEKVSSDEKKSINLFNEGASDDCKMSISREFDFISIGHEDALCYGRSQTHDKAPKLYYCIAISPHHYMTISFRYLSVRDTEAVWYKMAKSLEQQILSSIKLELNDSMQALKEDN